MITGVQLISSRKQTVQNVSRRVFIKHIEDENFIRKLFTANFRQFDVIKAFDVIYLFHAVFFCFAQYCIMEFMTKCYFLLFFSILIWEIHFSLLLLLIYVIPFVTLACNRKYFLWNAPHPFQYLWFNFTRAEIWATFNPIILVVLMNDTLQITG